MIIQCDKCSTKFRLDDSKVASSAVKVRCTKCRNVFVVQPPQIVEAAEIEEQTGREEAMPATPPAPKRPGRPLDERYNLNLDFSRPDEDMTKQDREQGAPLPEKDEGASTAPDLSFGDIDLNSIGRQKADVDTEKIAAAQSLSDATPNADAVEKPAPPTEEPRKPAVPQAGSGQDAFDFDFGMEGEEKAAAPPLPLEKAAGAGKGAQSVSKEKTARAFGDSPAVRPPADEQASEARDTASFRNAFEEALAKESPEEMPGAPAREATRPATRRPMPAWIPAIIAAGAVIVIGLALIYASGGGERFAEREQAAVGKPIDIETINGYMAENKNIGRVFVIEALIRNVTDSAQGIKEVRGVIYNSSGARVIDRIVSPGRVVGAEDLKNLPKEGLIKALSDTSGSIIPPKATVPVMVLFTEIPENMAEYGLDVIL